jgi:hypothetical protein
VRVADPVLSHATRPYARWDVTMPARVERLRRASGQA